MNHTNHMIHNNDIHTNVVEHDPVVIDDDDDSGDGDFLFDSPRLKTRHCSHHEEYKRYIATTKFHVIPSMTSTVVNDSSIEEEEEDDDDDDAFGSIPSDATTNSMMMLSHHCNDVGVVHDTHHVATTTAMAAGGVGKEAIVNDSRDDDNVEDDDDLSYKSYASISTSVLNGLLKAGGNGDHKDCDPCDQSSCISYGNFDINTVYGSMNATPDDPPLSVHDFESNDAIPQTVYATNRKDNGKDHQMTQHEELDEQREHEKMNNIHHHQQQEQHNPTMKVDDVALQRNVQDISLNEDSGMVHCTSNKSSVKDIFRNMVCCWIVIIFIVCYGLYYSIYQPSELSTSTLIVDAIPNTTTTQMKPDLFVAINEIAAPIHHQTVLTLMEMAPIHQDVLAIKEISPIHRQSGAVPPLSSSSKNKYENQEYITSKSSSTSHTPTATVANPNVSAAPTYSRLNQKYNPLVWLYNWVEGIRQMWLNWMNYLKRRLIQLFQWMVGLIVASIVVSIVLLSYRISRNFRGSTTDHNGTSTNHTITHVASSNNARMMDYHHNDATSTIGHPEPIQTRSHEEMLVQSSTTIHHHDRVYNFYKFTDLLDYMKQSNVLLQRKGRASPKKSACNHMFQVTYYGLQHVNDFHLTSYNRLSKEELIQLIQNFYHHDGSQHSMSSSKTMLKEKKDMLQATLIKLYYNVLITLSNEQLYDLIHVKYQTRSIDKDIGRMDSRLSMVSTMVACHRNEMIQQLLEMGF
jgi:hypothetical protein